MRNQADHLADNKPTNLSSISSSVNTYKANGNENGYKADFKKPATLGLFAESGITAPGGILIPVCSAREAWLNWVKVYNDEPKTPNYPCN